MSIANMEHGTIRITVKLFAILRDRAGVGELSIELPADSSVAGASSQIASRFSPLKDLLPRIAFAVNREYAKLETILHDGDELALIPAVSGG